MIDMDILLGDANFFEPMTVYRRQQAIGSNGIGTTTPVLVNPAPLGSIQSGANPELVRNTDYSTTANLITVYTDFRLIGDGSVEGMTQGPEAIATVDAYGNQIAPAATAAYSADVVMFHGDPYEVFLVQDWTDYGVGFVQAICRKISMSQAALL